MGKIVNGLNEVEVHFEPEELTTLTVNVRPGECSFIGLLGRAAEDLVREKVTSLKDTKFDVCRMLPGKLALSLHKKGRPGLSERTLRIIEEAPE